MRHSALPTEVGNCRWDACMGFLGSLLQASMPIRRSRCLLLKHALANKCAPA
jgi:hypothetical protein